MLQLLWRGRRTRCNRKGTPLIGNTNGSSPNFAFNYCTKVEKVNVTSKAVQSALAIEPRIEVIWEWLRVSEVPVMVNARHSENFGFARISVPMEVRHYRNCLPPPLTLRAFPSSMRRGLRGGA